jgi:hypothetical protein
MIHRKRRVDENQLSIVKALRDIGAFVMDLSGAGGGICDLIVCYRHTVWMIEVKNPLKPRLDRQLTPAQVKMHAEIARVGCEVHVIHTVGEAIRLVTGHNI